MGGERVGPRQAIRLSLAPFLAAKVVTLGVIYLAFWQHGHGTGIPGWHEAREAYAYWDGQSYLSIATHGYPAGTDLRPGAPGHLWGFFPGYPILVSIVTPVLRDAILAGIAISAVCELVALCFVAALVAAERDLAAARLATWIVALAPFGVFLSVVFTESAFLAAAAACLYFARRGRWAAAAFAGALALAARVTGMVLLAVLLVEFVRQRGWRPRVQLCWLAIVPVPLLAFMLYAHLRVGDALVYFHVQQSASFHRALTSPLSGLAATYAQVAAPGADRGTTYTFAVELVLGVAGAIGCLLLWTWRWLSPGRTTRVAASLSLYATGVWLLAVAQPYWLSIGRYELAMLPLVLPLGDVVARRPQWAGGVLVLSGGVMLFLATVWAQGSFVA